MASQPLRGRKVAILLAPAGSEQVEFTEPKKAVQDAGADIDVIGMQPGEARTCNHDLEPGETFAVDKAFDQVSADDYDALLVPAARSARTSSAVTPTRCVWSAPSSRPASRPG